MFTKNSRNLCYFLTTTILLHFFSALRCNHAHEQIFLSSLDIPKNGQMDDIKNFLDHDKLIMVVINQHNNVSTAARIRRVYL